MCGICGVIDWSESPDTTALVRRMTPTMLHRGPDDEGYLDAGISNFGIRNADFGEGARREKRSDVGNRNSSSGGSISIGMRRLSIIDIEGGHQPVFNEDGKVGVVLNGEIYNFQELQKQLVDRGHRFRTRSDSEVVAHSYEEWGADCVKRFEGMFAIAVYDRRENARRSSEFQVSSTELDVNGGEGTLFLARDRLGIKPLYYTVPGAEFGVSSSEFRVGKYFLFASEVRTLLASGLVPRQVSRDALESYLLFGSVSEPMTLVEGVLSLPPGHRMIISLNPAVGAAKVERYWNIATPASAHVEAPINGHGKKSDLKASAKQVRTLLEKSVRKHLIADVPVGVFLSSGIDSTALAALASREVSGVHTFTVAFPEQEFSEAVIARRTAERFGTTHQEVMLSADEMLARLSDAVGALDQPSIDGINTYLVSWSARQAGLKVALSGLGGDEVFGGYSTFSRTVQYQRMATVGSRVPAGVRSVMAAAVAESGGRLIAGDAARKLASLWKGPHSLPDPFYFGRALFPPTQVSALIRGTKSGELKGPWWDWLAQSAEQARSLNPFAAVSCMEAESYLVSTLLRDTDSMSMAHSLEVRVPFLDHPLVEFVTQLPQEAKLRKGIPKALLVAALEDLLPAEVAQQTKRGFTLPWAEWLRGSLRNRVANGFSELSPALQEMINAETAQGVWQSYLKKDTTWSRPWSLYVLNEWTKAHLDQEPSAGGSGQ
jgi:asparagine synthase (glutamine-hydrolysing)